VIGLLRMLPFAVSRKTVRFTVIGKNDNNWRDNQILQKNKKPPIWWILFLKSLSPKTRCSCFLKIKEGKYLHRIRMNKKCKAAATIRAINQKIRKKRWGDRCTKRTLSTYKNLSWIIILVSVLSIHFPRRTSRSTIDLITRIRTKTSWRNW
jgi:hypothetical protein